VAFFQPSKNTTQGTTTSPQKHHDFTTKKPSLSTHFPLNPLQKTPQKAQNPTLHHPTDFFRKKQKNAAPAN
jgi:hypothetical protein